MKKLTLLFAVVCLSLGVAFAQHDGIRSADHVAVSVSRTPPVLADGFKVGPNYVTVRVIRDGKIIHEETNHNLKTTVGIDAMIAQVGTTGSQPAAFNYLALTADSGSPAIGDTTLASEISTSGLGRAQATYAHTGSTSTWTEVHTWTASGTVSSIQKAGMFNAASSGTLGFEATFSPVTLNSGDQLQLTWTITAS